MRFRYLLHLWFGFSIPVSRAAYLTTGCALMGAKYVVESLVVYLVTGQFWSPDDYLLPSIDRYTRLGSGSPLAWGLAIWSLPFIWIGASMTTRRALNAGISAAWGLLFFVPLVNDLTMLVLAALPTAAAGSGAGSQTAGQSQRAHSGLRSAALGVLLGTAIAVAMTGVSTSLMGHYGSVLFVGTPFVMGFVAGGLYNRDAERSIRATIAIVFVTMLAASGVVLLVAMEGAFCLVMAFPLAFVLAIVGALLGRVTGRERRLAAAPFVILLAALPALLGFAAGDPNLPLREVVSQIDVAASPAAVWDNVIRFGELPPPEEWEFRHGVAYPMRARIDGEGVGAVRRCEFSTGVFVEPITTWDPGRRLSFDVRDQPPTMRELSPYDQVRAPHLSGYLRSHRGEFRLTALPGGGTRLEGSTFYSLDIHPGWYWTRFADRLIGRIHMRVLRHIKSLSEPRATF